MSNYEKARARVCVCVPQRKEFRRLRQVRGVIRDDLDDDIPANIESGRHAATSITTASVPDDDARWSTDETAHNNNDSEIIANIFLQCRRPCRHRQ